MIVLGQTLQAQTPLTEGLKLRPLEPDDRRRITAVVDERWGRPMGGLLPRRVLEAATGCVLIALGVRLAAESQR